MKRKMLSHLCCGALLLSFLLGVHNGRVAMWKDEDPEPCKVFPCPVIVLPRQIQEDLKVGIRLETMEDVNRLLENFLS